MRNIAITFSISVLLVLFAFNPVGVRSYKIDKIVIDPGHGGSDPGAVGINGLFIECHDNPDVAPSDGMNMIKLNKMPELIKKLSHLFKFCNETIFD